MFGYFVGDYIIKRGKTAEMVNGLFVGGIVFLFAGYMWDMVFPMNKKIWSSSYTVFTTGMAMSIIALMFFFKSWIGSPLSFGLAFFLSILELLVAFLQAYIFTMLTSLYFGAANQEHSHEEAH